MGWAHPRSNVCPPCPLFFPVLHGSPCRLFTLNPLGCGNTPPALALHRTAVTQARSQLAQLRAEDRQEKTCTSTPASLSSRALVAFSAAKTSYVGLGWLPLPLATCSCNGAVLTGVRPQPPAAFLQPPSRRMLALPHSTTLARKCFCPHSAELDTLMHMPFSFDIRGWSMSTCTGAGRSS